LEGSLIGSKRQRAARVVALLAARAPKLRRAVRDPVKARYPFAVLDGTLIRTNRLAAD
jgi:hypothetical protein